MTTTRSVVAAAFSVLFLFLLAPSALAQGLPNPGDLGDTVGDTTGGATDTVGGATGGATDAVEDTTGGVTDTVGGATGGATSGSGGGGTVGGTVGGITDTVGGATGGSGGGDGGGGTVGGTVGGVTNTVGGITGGSGGSGGGDGGGDGGDGGGITDTINDTVGGLTGGNGSTENGGGGSNGSLTDSVLGGGLQGPGLEDLTPELIDDLVDDMGLSPAAAKGWIEGRKLLADSAYDSPREALNSLSQLVGTFANIVAMESGAPTSTSTDLVLTTEPQGETFFQAAGRVATEAAKTLAFPAALALLVVGFLMVQGRIGRKDPKLVLAPVDTTEESLTFE